MYNSYAVDESLIGAIIVGAIIAIVIVIIKSKSTESYDSRSQFEECQVNIECNSILASLNLPTLRAMTRRVPYIDEMIAVKSRAALDKYDCITFFKSDPHNLDKVEKALTNKINSVRTIKTYLQKNTIDSYVVKAKFNELIANSLAYRVKVSYVTSAGNTLASEIVAITPDIIAKVTKNPTLLMSKTEQNKILKEQTKAQLEAKQHSYYNLVNQIIDYANANKKALILNGSQERLDELITQLFDRTVNGIKKIKSLDGDEWELIDKFIDNKKTDVEDIVETNMRIVNYYDSDDFLTIKNTCDALMSTQREFNEYIAQKVDSISKLFGVRIVRESTYHTDKYNYLRPYKKTITPFVAEVSSAVFASAENNPLEYIVKHFYPNKSMYPEQIQQLSHLVEELQTLREAKQIIDNYKQQYNEYIVNVPDFVMENDADGFYARLGFATINESVLNVEYKFSYTSNGGMAQRSFAVPMTEENIVALIKMLENKLTSTAFVKEQRGLMTKKLRDAIKARDNFTCCNCGNSTFIEPNLLLEIDHIVPVAKGGRTVEDNLQTLCWKCNRAKSDKLVD